MTTAWYLSVLLMCICLCMPVTCEYSLVCVFLTVVCGDLLICSHYILLNNWSLLSSFLTAGVNVLLGKEVYLSSNHYPTSRLPSLVTDGIKPLGNAGKCIHTGFDAGWLRVDMERTETIYWIALFAHSTWWHYILKAINLASI